MKRQFSEETRKKISEALKKSHARGDRQNIFSAEVRKKMSEKRKSFYKKNKHPLRGKRRNDIAGENHPNYKHGLSDKDHIQRVNFRRSMQKLVFERDNYTCQLCGVRGVDLQVDHIQSWAEYIELRFNMNNCRTVCAKCHYLITYGKPMPDNVKGWGHNLLKGGDLP